MKPKIITEHCTEWAVETKIEYEKNLVKSISFTDLHYDFSTKYIFEYNSQGNVFKIISDSTISELLYEEDSLVEEKTTSNEVSHLSLSTILKRTSINKKSLLIRNITYKYDSKKILLNINEFGEKYEIILEYDLEGNLESFSANSGNESYEKHIRHGKFNHYLKNVGLPLTFDFGYESVNKFPDEYRDSKGNVVAYKVEKAINNYPSLITYKEDEFDITVEVEY